MIESFLLRNEKKTKKIKKKKEKNKKKPKLISYEKKEKKQKALKKHRKERFKISLTKHENRVPKGVKNDDPKKTAPKDLKIRPPCLQGTGRVR